MKVKTSNLIGPALDWAVAKAEGRTDVRIDEDGDLVGQYDFDYSTDWAQGGPIISRIKIDLHHCQNGEGKYKTLAQLREDNDVTGKLLAYTWAHHGEGPDLDLIAAMRCYVASIFGDEVEVPDGLFKG